MAADYRPLRRAALRFSAPFSLVSVVVMGDSSVTRRTCLTYLTCRTCLIGWISALRSGLFVLAIHVFAESALFQEAAALAFDLPFEQEDRLMDCADHCVACQFRVGLGDEISKPGEPR